MVPSKEVFPVLFYSPVIHVTEQQDFTVDQTRSHQTRLFVTTVSPVAKNSPSLLGMAIDGR